MERLYEEIILDEKEQDQIKVQSQVIDQTEEKRRTVLVKSLLDGRTISIDVLPSDSFRYIKSQIQEKIGVPLEEQRLVINGTNLDDDKTISDYSIINDMFYLARALQKIYVRTPQGDTLTLNVLHTDSIKYIKRQIQQRVNVPPGEQSLVFGKNFLDDEKTLSDYNLIGRTINFYG